MYECFFFFWASQKILITAHVSRWSRELEKHQPCDFCAGDTDAVKHYLLDAEISKTVETEWMQQFDQEPDVVAMFSAGNGGLTRIYPKGWVIMAKQYLHANLVTCKGSALGDPDKTIL